MVGKDYALVQTENKRHVCLSITNTKPQNFIEFGTVDLWAFDKQGNFYLPPGDNQFKFGAKHRARMNMSQAASMVVKAKKLLGSGESGSTMGIQAMNGIWSVRYDHEKGKVSLACDNVEPYFYSKITGEKPLSKAFMHCSGIGFPLTIEMTKSEWELASKRLGQFAGCGEFFD